MLLTVALSSALKIPLSFVSPGPLAAVLYGIFPLASLVCWGRARIQPPERRVAPTPLTARDRSVVGRYALGVAVFGVAIGFTRLLGPGYFFTTLVSGIVSHGIEVAVCLAIAALLYRTREALEFSDLWMLVLMVIATGLLVLDFSTGMAHVLATAIFSAAQMLAYTFLLLAIVDVAQRVTAPSDAVMGLGYPIYSLPMALVSLGAPLVGGSSQKTALVVVYVLLVSVCCFIRRGPSGKPVLFGGLAAAVAGGPDALACQLEVFARTYGLTERECEVARLYAQGLSRAFIGGELCISENTVRDHISRIYKKARVHNKQEFIDALQR